MKILAVIGTISLTISNYNNFNLSNNLYNKKIIATFNSEETFSDSNKYNVNLNVEDISYNDDYTYSISISSYKSDFIDNYIESLKNNVHLKFLENDYIYYGNESEISFNESQKHLDLLNMNKTRKLTKGNKNIKVGVLDTGVDINHKSLSNNIDNSLAYNFINNNQDVTDYANHGTHVAGIIAANGLYNNVYGIAPNVTVVPLKSGEKSENGSIFYTSDIIEAINYSNKNNIKLLNMSIGGAIFSLSLRNAMNNYNGLIVCSAGNQSSKIDDYIDTYPAKYHLDNMIVVGNCKYDGNVYFESNYSNNLVDLFTYGTSIYSTKINDNYGSMTGTSMSAPIVTGIASLMLSLKPTIDIEELKQNILNNVSYSSYLKDYCLTSGYLNSFDSVHFMHSYINKFIWEDYKYHNSFCICDEFKKEGHVISGGDIINGIRKGICKYCGGEAQYGLVEYDESDEDFIYYIKQSDGLYYPNKTVTYYDVKDLSYEETY